MHREVTERIPHLLYPVLEEREVSAGRARDQHLPAPAHGGAHFASSSATFKKSEKNDSGSFVPVLPSKLPTFHPANLTQMSIARSIAHSSIHASA